MSMVTYYEFLIVTRHDLNGKRICKWFESEKKAGQGKCGFFLCVPLAIDLQSVAVKESPMTTQSEPMKMTESQE